MTYFDHLVGPLKRSAIDAWMKSHSAGSWQIEGDKYRISSTAGDATVTRPDEQGEGGGDWETGNFIADLFGVDRDGEFQGAFADIRDRIDSALSPWRSIPDRSDFSDHVEAIRQANRELGLGPTSAGGGQTGGGNIGGILTGIEGSVDKMNGRVIDAFETKFLLQLRKAVAGHHGITVILGAALAAEEEIYVAARDGVVKTIEESQAAFDAFAQGGSADWLVLLDIVGWAKKGVESFLKADVSGIAETVRTGANGLQTVQDAAEGVARDASGNSWEDLMSAFEKMLATGEDAEENTINWSIREEERKLRENLVQNAGNVRADKDSYSLEATILPVDDAGDLGTDVVIVEESAVDSITNSYMPAVADELDEAKSKVISTSFVPGFHYGGAIGDPPSSEYYDLQWLLYELLNKLSWEVRNGAKTLRLAIDDLLHADAQAQRELTDHHRRITREPVGQPGGPYNPWD